MPRIWKILLVDDDEDEFVLTGLMLAEAKGGKLSLEWAPTFEIGRQKLLTDSYHAVLVDYDLGSANGLDLIREAVANQYKAPFILYTGCGSIEVDEAARESGATLYLLKSEASPILLERIIRSAIKIHQSKKAPSQPKDELETLVARLRGKLTDLDELQSG